MTGLLERVDKADTFAAGDEWEKKVAQVEGLGEVRIARDMDSLNTQHANRNYLLNCWCFITGDSPW